MSAGTQKSAHLEHEIADARGVRDLPRNDAREWQAQRLRLLWQRRRFFAQVALGSLFFFTLVAFLIPRQFTATTVLMPPDSQSASGLAMMAMAAKGAGGLGSMAGDLLGLKSSGALFIGVLRSQTSQNRMVEQFNLRKVYGKKLIADAREKLDQNTSISEDRKSGMLYINVTDHSAERSAALANAYVDGLNSLVAELSTSSARRERQFLDERLKVIKQDLDTASTELAQFSSRNNTLDIKDEGKAMLEAAANLSGQMIAAQSQLQGLRQIYTDNNPRVRSLNARVMELRRELEKLGGESSAAGEKPGAHPATMLAGVSSVGPRGLPAADEERGGVPRPANMPYPTLKSLPLLGVKYADYYRHAKIQETVFELLTEQDELAKVQEAKEIPSVKVLDGGKVPEKKSFPPRLSIIFVGAGVAMVLATFWVLAAARWQEADPFDPRKLFLQDLMSRSRERNFDISRNGNSTVSHVPEA